MSGEQLERIKYGDLTEYVTNKKQFITQYGRIIAAWSSFKVGDTVERVYTVRSTVGTYPLYIYSENLDKWFSSPQFSGTNRDKSITQPKGVGFEILDGPSMLRIAEFGVTGAIKHIMLGE